MSAAQPPSIGPHIREIRKDHGFTLEELSLKSGVSKSMLSQIETESVNPTIATVWKIAGGLGIEFRALLSGKEEELGRLHISRRQDAVLLDLDDGKVQLMVLTPLTMVDDLEMYLLKMDAGGFLESQPHQAGCEEYLMAFEGRIEVRAGEQVEILEAEDSIIYSADLPHSIRAIGDQGARAHLTVRFGHFRNRR